jgi:hypothetical protein
MKVKAKIKVEGIKPVLFHAFPISALSEKNSKNGEDEWKETVTMDQDRHLYLCGIQFKNSIAAGGKEIKVGRGSLFKKIESTLEVEEIKILLEGLFVPDDDNLLKLDTEPVYLDVRSVVNPATRGRNIRYRIAAKMGWKCEFHVTWDDYICSKEQLKMCVENAASFQGVGDGRKIGFGRYKILSFEIQK